MNDFDYYNWLVLPLIIFASRFGDVTLSTIRHVMTSRGYKSISPVLGFFEVLIWIVVVSQIMKQANNFACYIAWAGGFAAGNYIGLLIEEKIALGLQIIRIITNRECSELIDHLQKSSRTATLCSFLRVPREPDQSGYGRDCRKFPFPVVLQRAHLPCCKTSHGKSR